MKKLILVFCILGIAFAFFKYSPNNNNKKKLEVATNQKKVKTSKDLFQKPLTKIIIDKDMGNKGNTEQIHPCHDLYDNLVQFDLKDVKEIDLTHFKEYLDIKSCHDFLAKNPPHFAELFNECFSSKATTDNMKCFTMFVFLRADAAVELSPSIDEISNWEDSALMNGLLSKFLKFGKGTPEKKSQFYEEFKRINEELISRFPDLYPAHKAKVVGAFVMDKSLLQNKEWVKKNFELLQNLNPEDDELISFSLIPYLQDLDKLDQKTDDIIATFPNNFQSYYFKSFSFWERGEKEMAISHLNKALQMNPNAENVKQTLDSIKKGATKEDKIFNYSMNFNFIDI